MDVALMRPGWVIRSVDVVMTVMADRHSSCEKLAPVFSSKSRLSEFLNRKRGMTMAVANGLHDELQIPASILIRPYALVPRAPFGRKPERVRAGGAGA